MPPPRKNRNCVQADEGKAAIGSGQVYEQVNQQIKQEIFTEDETHDLIRITGESEISALNNFLLKI